MTKLRRSALLLAPALLLVLLSAACGAISQPQGWAAPVNADAGILASLRKGKLALFDKTDHHQIWEFPPSSDKTTKLKGIYGTPVVAGDKVVFGDYNGKVYALKLTDGTPVWQAPFDTQAAIVGGVAVDGGAVYVGNSDGKLFALDLENGSRKQWASGGAFKADDRIWSTPVVQQGVVYVTSMDRKVYALKAADGSLAWKNADADGAITSTPTLIEDRLFFGAFDKRLYALDVAHDGKEVWKSKPANNWFWGHALVQNGMLYTGSLDGSVYGVNASDGAIQWQQKLGDSIRGRPALAQGVLVVADRKGRVRGFDPTTGAPQWDKATELNSSSLGDLVVSDDGAAVWLLTDGGSAGTRLVAIDPKTGVASDVVKP